MRTKDDEFLAKVKDTLAKRAGMKCSNPDCRVTTSGPRDEPTKSVNVGEAAHITAAAPGGPRYDASLTPGQRCDINNGIWLCQRCHALVDQDEQHYTIALLREWKAEAEEAARRELETGRPTAGDNRPARIAPPRADISRILKYAPAQLIGREEETRFLNDAWLKVRRAESHRAHVLTFVALGGEGKTSLVAKWVASLADDNWPGCDAAFAWSFYSQGTREQHAASSDLFLKAALAFFGDKADKAFAASSAGAFEKGQRLARLVGQRRSLLILDGLEPLQYAPTAPTPGELKDQGIAALLRALAAASQGLCVVTTRYSLPDLRAFWQTTAPEVKLLRLSRDAGVHLLKTLGVRGAAQEFATLVEDVKGHALTLTLLGGFLKRAFHGDLRQRDRVKFEKADEKMDGGHAFRTMAAYEQWLLSGGDEGRREVAVLRLMGLFDRPADAGCLAALRREIIPGLTEPLAGLADDDWEYCLSGLEAAKLLTVNRDATGALVSLDAHPHLREYFARQLRSQQPDGWRAAHRRLYEHLCKTTTDQKPNPNLEDLQPLYQAIFHGCKAGKSEEALSDVYCARVLRGNEHFSWKQLGTLGADLAAISNFFQQPWNKLNSEIAGEGGDFVLLQVGLYLRGLGRLTEAVQPMQTGLENRIREENWMHASIFAGNLSELHLALGEVAVSVCDAEQGLGLADQSNKWAERIRSRTTLADALHQAGRLQEALTIFSQAETIQKKLPPYCPLLSLYAGHLYCDALLTRARFSEWLMRTTFNSHRLTDFADTTLRSSLELCQEVRARVNFSFQDAQSDGTFLEVAANHLTFGRVLLLEAVLQGVNAGLQIPQAAIEHLDEAVNELRCAHRHDKLPCALLTRAWLRFLNGARSGPGSAQADLDEAWEIAERGPMKLFMADIHLHRARLFFREPEYPWNHHPDGTPRGPKDDLAAAEKLINDCGYHRRDEELADAKRAILGS